ncbi:Acetylornithine deacetylase [hydrothermal vent metagenome]|uniref:Acetylornithine deacetylase n=1 Tax=hydrothermal vent metagenome TaxID=652676 RepID=A0A3B0WEP6_9ZZZZ
MTITIDPVELTSQLVQIPSESSTPLTTRQESAEELVAAHLSSICRQAEVEHELFTALPGRRNLIARFPAPGRPSLLIMAHMDTVSAREMSAPFSGEIKEGRLLGRGACDDKGPLAAAFAALINIKAENRAFDTTFAATVDEECTMSGSRALALRKPEFDLCIALEPTTLRVIHAHKGVYRCRIICGGKACHSSQPEQGQNAIIAMYDIMTDLQRLEFKLRRHPDRELGRASLAITKINGGSSINIIPDHCEISVDIRLLPSHDPAEAARQIRAICAGRAKVEDIFQARAIKTDLDNQHIKRLRRATAAQGHDLPPATASYATDCAQLCHLGPCIVWGPGDIAQAHQQNEYIELEQLRDAHKILLNFLSVD